MASSRLNPEKKKLIDKILKNEIEVNYKKIEKDYIGDFCNENQIEYDFEITSVILSGGEISGLAKCTKCAKHFQVIF